MHNHRKQTGQTDYLMLLVVIIIGVTAGNLLSTWITTRIAAHQLEQTLNTAGEQLAADQAAYRRQQEINQAMSREQRANSRTGLFLKKSCDEWKVTHERYPNHTSNQEMQKACGHYETFLETGISPVNGGF